MDGNAPSTEDTIKYPRMAYAIARVWPDNQATGRPAAEPVEVEQPEAPVDEPTKPRPGELLFFAGKDAGHAIELYVGAREATNRVSPLDPPAAPAKKSRSKKGAK